MGKRRQYSDFYQFISELNMTNAMRSSIALSIAFPIIIIAAAFVEWDNPALKTVFILFAVIMELVQLSFVGYIFVNIKRDEFDKYNNIYLMYFAITIGIMMVESGFDIKAFGSEFFYIASCVYLIFVPVFSDKERLTFIAGQTVIMMSMVIGFDMNIRCVIDVCLAQLATVFVSRYQHNMAVKKIRLNMVLKRKTETSEHDPLTGLYNRRGLEARTNAIWPFCERNRIPVGIITIDIDFFKKYNDAFGHPKGDECLREVANVLKHSAQRSTDVVTRTGGEEFIIFVQDTDSNNIVALAMKIRKALEDRAIPQAYTEISKNVTVSIGAASFVPSYGKTFQDLYEEADRSLYIAKNNGRNCIVYNGNLYGKIRNGMAKVVSI